MSTQPTPGLDILYRILVQTARNQRYMHYEDVSAEYQRITGVFHHPHGSWDRPLGEINHILHSNGLPALSAVVVLKPDPPGGQVAPGGGFWGSCPGVPIRPRNDLQRLAEWSRILAEVHRTNWPDKLPPG
jgi:hypothetical protein